MHSPHCGHVTDLEKLSGLIQGQQGWEKVNTDFCLAEQSRMWCQYFEMWPWSALQATEDEIQQKQTSRTQTVHEKVKDKLQRELNNTEKQLNGCSHGIFLSGIGRSSFCVGKAFGAGVPEASAVHGVVAGSSEGHGGRGGHILPHRTSLWRWWVVEPWVTLPRVQWAWVVGVVGQLWGGIVGRVPVSSPRLPWVVLRLHWTSSVSTEKIQSYDSTRDGDRVGKARFFTWKVGQFLALSICVSPLV